MTEAAPTSQRLGVLGRIIWFIDPESHPEGMIYGLVVVGSVVAAESVHAGSATRDILAAFVVLIVYWLAHTYASILGHRYSNGEEISMAEVRRTFSHEWAIVRGAAVPLLIMVVGALFGLSSWRVDEIGLVTAVAMLFIFALVGGIRAKQRPVVVAIESLIALGFGAAIVLIRAVLA